MYIKREASPNRSASSLVLLRRHCLRGNSSAGSLSPSFPSAISPRPIIILPCANHRVARTVGICEKWKPIPHDDNFVGRRQQEPHPRLSTSRCELTRGLTLPLFLRCHPVLGCRWELLIALADNLAPTHRKWKSRDGDRFGGLWSISGKT